MVQTTQRTSVIADSRLRRFAMRGARPASDDRAEGEGVKPRPGIRKPADPRGEHRDGSDDEKRRDERSDRDGRAPPCRVAQLAQTKLTAAVEEHDHEGERAEVRRDGHELLARDEARDRADENPDRDEPNDIRHAASFENELAHDADEKDRRDRQEKERDRIHAAEDDCMARRRIEPSRRSL
jgi:hypothetical protein